MSASTIKIIDPEMALKPNIEDADLIPYWGIVEAAMVKLTYANLKTDIIDTTSDDTEILFNNAGILDGDPRLTYNPTTNLLTVPVIVFDRTVDSQLNAVSQTQVGMVATIPDLNLTGAQNFVFENFTQALTEKTIVDISNTVNANAVHVEVFNITGSTLNNGQLVYISGYNIGQDLEEVDLADATSMVTMPVLGLVSGSISNGQRGIVLISGTLMGVDTSSFSVNDGIYATTTPGAFGIRPTGINDLVQKVGLVLRSHATLGVIEIIGAGRENDNSNSFASNTLKIRNPADTFAYTIVGDAIAADRNVTLPLLTVNDTFVTEAFAQTITNKTINADNNTITNIGDSEIVAHTTTKITTTDKSLLNANIAYIDQANIFGDFAQTFADNQLFIQNPAASFEFQFIASAIIADRSITLPLLTGNDTFVTEAFAQTLTNKTFDATSNVWRTSGTSTLTATTNISRATNNLDLNNLLITDTLITSSVGIDMSANDILDVGILNLTSTPNEVSISSGLAGRLDFNMASRQWSFSSTVLQPVGDNTKSIGLAASRFQTAFFTRFRSGQNAADNYTFQVYETGATAAHRTWATITANLNPSVTMGKPPAVTGAGTFIISSSDSITTDNLIVTINIDITDNGSAAIPAIGIGQDNDGFYRSALNEISLSLNNIQEYIFGVATFTLPDLAAGTTMGGTVLSVVGHTHAAVDVISGTFLDARIAQSNVTQHEAALTILETQITDGSILARVAGNETISGNWIFSNAIDITADGTAAIPALRIGTEDDGFYRSAVNELSLSLNNIQEYIFGANTFTLNGVDLAVPANGNVGTPAVRIGVDEDGFYRNAINELSLSLNNIQEYIFGVATFTLPDLAAGTTMGGTVLSVVGHTHAAVDVISGTFLDARIAQSNVTQHEAALTILESQITDGSILARVAGNENISGNWTFTNAVDITANGTVAIPALRIGTEDDGIYRSAVNELSLSINNVQTVQFRQAVTEFNTEIITDVAGTASDPAIAFGTELDGFYRSGVNELSISLNNAQQHIFAVNQVTISRFALIKSTAVNTATLQIENTSTGDSVGIWTVGAQSYYFGIDNSTANDPIMFGSGSVAGANVVWQYNNTDDIMIVEKPLRLNGNVGFYNTAPQSKPTITGSRGGNAALADLLTDLASLGLITDSTTA